MGNDLNNFRPAFLKLQEDMERLSRVIEPSFLGICEQMEKAFEPIRRHHLEITRAIELSGFTSSRMLDIVHANQHWQDLIDQASTSARVFEDLT
jgi:hypothetical protein